MSTLYDLFKVKENATQEEIKTAYENIIKKAETLPQNDKTIEQTRRIKIAYGILSDNEKRKKYDLDLATKRADELLGNIQIKETISTENKENVENVKTEDSVSNEETVKKVISPEDEQRLKQAIQRKIENIIENEEKQKQEQIINEKEIRKQERKKKRQLKKQQQLKREMEIQAYGEYLSKQGYKVKYPWTWIRIKRLLITILVIIITLLILWNIPYVRNMLTDLYNENFLVRILTNLIVSIFTSIIDAIKGIFK